VASRAPGAEIESLAELSPVCILAGGLGTRLGERVRATPKPLLDVAGQPFLVHQLRLLASTGVRAVVLCVGYRGQEIQQEIGSERFGIAVRYSFDSPQLDGTLGAIRRALPLLGERFLVLYGDTYLRVDYADVDRRWRQSGLPAVMTVLCNESRWDVSNVAYADGRVLAYNKEAPTPDMRWIDYGLGGLTSEALSEVDLGERDLAGLYRRLASLGLLAGYEARERFYEIGTPRGLEEADAFLRALASAG
jgi:N-acetyl-alpha-D-muramate 1-phosphate uridylyltransferase